MSASCRVGLQTDIWSSLKSMHQLASYVCTVPDLSDGGGLRYFCIGVPKAPLDQTAIGLSAHIKQVIEKWGLTAKLSGITTDSTAVNPAAMLSVTPCWFGCTAHWIHNCVVEVCKIEEVAVIMDQVRTVVKMIRSGPKQADLFKQFEEYSMGSDLNVILDVKTRWNSAFLMLRSACNLMQAIRT